MKDYTDAAYEAAMQILHGEHGFFNKNQRLPFTAAQVAQIIDKATLLPQKHAALLLAQGVCDAYEKWDGSADRANLADAMDELVEALSHIKSK